MLLTDEEEEQSPGVGRESYRQGGLTGVKSFRILTMSPIFAIFGSS